MAFDGITVACIVQELRETILDGRIAKIAQPETDELMLTIKGQAKNQYRLSISADASLPLIYLTEENKKSPMTAPAFCMLLRKHIQGGRIIDIWQPGLERIIHIQIEHLNELGDLCQKSIVIEIMGKHSNIIFLDNENKIIDSIKHISSAVSSVREVLPGRNYFIPQTMDKKNPLELDEADGEDVFWKLLQEKSMPVFKGLYGNYTGISPVVSQEICYRANVDANKLTDSLSNEEIKKIYSVFQEIMESVKAKKFVPYIIYRNGEPLEYGVLPYTMYQEEEMVKTETISALLHTYYAQKSQITRIRQKSVDLRKVVQTALERNSKKYDLQLKQMQDTEKKEQYRIYGELLNAYGYGVEKGKTSMKALDYYHNEEIEIPLDKDLTALENAKKYFEKYGKLKRTYEALDKFIVETKTEIDHLESVMTALDITMQEEDLVQIKEELIESGYIRRKGAFKKEKITSKPFHFISSDGFHMYVGKNNFQNDELTFHFADNGDWWFHAKGFPGSHVIVKSGGKEMPDKTFEEAGRLAAYFSKARNQEKVEIDYVEKKHVKKPGGAKPGFVVYYTNYSMMIDANISGIETVQS